MLFGRTLPFTGASSDKAFIAANVSRHAFLLKRSGFKIIL
jgi:hypothetical protein